MAVYTISQVAEKYHMRPSTLRYYEDLGLLYNVPRQGGHRPAVHRPMQLADQPE